MTSKRTLGAVAAAAAGAGIARAVSSWDEIGDRAGSRPGGGSGADLWLALPSGLNASDAAPADRDDVG